MIGYPAIETAERLACEYCDPKDTIITIIITLVLHCRSREGTQTSARHRSGSMNRRNPDLQALSRRLCEPYAVLKHFVTLRVGNIAWW
jgi:hypothetical protein